MRLLFLLGLFATLSIFVVFSSQSAYAASSITITHANNPIPKWGESINVNGTSTNFAHGYTITINWGDHTAPSSIPASSTWGPVFHTYAKGTVGMHYVVAKLMNGPVVCAKSLSSEVNVTKHNTALTLAPIANLKWSFPYTSNSTVKGTLIDTDVTAGISNATIVVSGSGLGSLTSSVTTNGTGSYSDLGNAPPGPAASEILNVDYAGDVNYNPATTVTQNYNTLKHDTTLFFNPINLPFAGNHISVNGNLTDNDAAAAHLKYNGMPAKLVTFTSSSGVSIPNATTNGITFTDPSNLQVTVCSCSTAVNVLRLNPGAAISLPSNPPYVTLFLADMGGNTVTVNVTYGDGSTNSFTSPHIGSTPVPWGLASAHNVGITSIQITNVSGGLSGISEVQTLDGVLNQFQDIVFTPTLPTSQLFFNQGEFFSVGSTSTTAQTGLSVTSSFAGDAFYNTPSDSQQTFSTFFSTTAGIGSLTTTTTDIAQAISPTTCNSGGIDVDGLCNSWKGSGNGVPYNYSSYTGTAKTAKYVLAGSVVGTKAIYLEVDAMLSSNPYTNAINDVKTTFSNHGITLSIDNSDLNVPDKSPINVWSDTDTDFTNDFNSIKAMYFGDPGERPTWEKTQTTTLSGNTVQVNGIKIDSTPGDPNTIPPDITEGTINMNVNVNVASGTTVVAPSSSSIKTTGTTDSRIILGPITATVTQKSSTLWLLTIKAPFDTTGKINTQAGLAQVNVPLTVTGGSISGVTQAPLSPILTTTKLLAKSQVYHYMLFVNSIGGTSGESFTPGNKAVVALGASVFGCTGSSSTGTCPSEKMQAGTIMHELGHNLGLAHGGPATKNDATVNCKPNYESVMSYSRQLDTGYLGSHWLLDYSEGLLTGLNEAKLYESSTSSLYPTLKATAAYGSSVPSLTGKYPYVIWGVPSSATASTFKMALTNNTYSNYDWNGNGVISTANTAVSAPTSGMGINGCSETVAASQYAGQYNDYNDWNSLVFNFRTASGTTFSGSGSGSGSGGSLYTSADDAIGQDLDSDLNGPIVTTVTGLAAVYPGLMQPVAIDGSSVREGGSTLPLKFEYLKSGTVVTDTNQPDASTFLPNYAGFISANACANNACSSPTMGVIASQGQWVQKSDDGTQFYQFNWKTPRVTQTTPYYINIYINLPALQGTPLPLSSVLLQNPLTDGNPSHIVTMKVTLKPKGDDWNTK